MRDLTPLWGKFWEGVGVRLGRSIYTDSTPIPLFHFYRVFHFVNKLEETHTSRRS
jgi:hypothetical protein